VDEQTRIMTEVEARTSALNQIVTTVERTRARADRLRQAILKRAFEGKLVPQDPNNEPATVLLERIRAERSDKQPVLRTNGKRAARRASAAIGAK